MKSDNFEVSNGNLQVLRHIPDMMTKPEYRKRLRMLVLDYLSGGIE
jgi:hypothetical protein